MISNYKHTQNAFLPKTVTIPLLQEKDFLCKPTVKPGDILQEGDVIAKDEKTYIHSPIPGTVLDICSTHCPNGKIEKAIKIKFAGQFSYTSKNKKTNWGDLSPEAIYKKIEKHGIVNTFSSNDTISLYKQINKVLLRKNRSLIVRLFDEDTYRISDSLMSHFFLSQIIEGAKITAKALDADGILFVIDSKSTIDETILREKNDRIKVLKINSKKYTNGFKREIIYSFNHNMKKNCSFSVTRNDLFIDSYTLYDVYNCIIYDKPVISRYIHFSGNCLKASCFLNVRYGITIREMISQLGGFVKIPATVIINGRIVGNAVNSLDVPITKYVKSIEFLSKANTTDNQVYSCVKCGTCRFACPVGITPDILYEIVIKNKKVSDFYMKTSLLCTNCGICNTVCQARIPLSQVITSIKNKLDSNNEN